MIALVACVGDDPSHSSSGAAAPDAAIGDGDGGGSADASQADGGAPRGGAIDAAFSGSKDVRFETFTNVAVDASGRVYVVGHRRGCKAGGLTDVMVARIGETGAVDAAYGTGARACVNTYGANAGSDFHETAGGVAIDAAGRALIAGASVDNGNQDKRLFVARLTDTGALDTSFGGKGFVRLATLPEGSATAMVLDGTSIWLAGRGKAGGGLLAKLDANGTPDAAFGTQGAVLDASVDSYTAVAVSPAGVFVAAAGGAGFAVKKYGAANGAPDTSFGSGGTATLEVSASVDEAHMLAIDASGRLLVAGLASAGSVGQPGRIAAVRLLATGAPDTSFPTFTSGSVMWPTSAQAHGYVQADGKLLLPGIIPGGRDFAVVRLGVDAKLDPSYGTNGVSAGTDSRDDVTIAIAADPKSGGTIVLADPGDEVTENVQGADLPFRRPALHRLSR